MPGGPAPPGGRRFDAEKGVGCLHRRAGAERQPSTRALESTPCVCVCSDVRPVLIRKLAIGDRVDWLHRCDYADACEPLHVFRVDALRMLDPGPPETPRLAVRHERVERPSHRAVTDGMQAHV